jgi:NADH-quinone oxidoreductase subunit L
MVSEAQETQLLRWIPALPLASALIHGLWLTLVRRPFSRALVIALSCGSVIAAFGVSCLAFVQLVQLPEAERALSDAFYTWIGSDNFSAEAAFRLDALSAVMILVVTGIGSLIHVYSIGYMDDDHREDRGFQRFFCYLNLFTFAMLVLVLADNLALTFLGWEGVGLCSYLLIGFWYSDRSYAYCGSKAFIVNRIGDFGFLVGTFLLFWSLADAGHPTVAYHEIQQAFPAIADATVRLPEWLSFLPGAPDWKLATVIGLLFFLGAAGKSAQIPLYVWLPDAMAGPTPVSALIHAATMVTAGVYLVCRLGFLYDAAPGAAATIAWVGAATALFSATIALVQTDIKKVLAYSTVSQLGYMFLAAGVGAYSAATFHVVTHAFFKALLFLGAGAVILAMHHEQDMTRYGGLRRHIPRVHLVLLAGVIGISAIPYVSAGFFSKDEILLSAFLADHVPGNRWLHAIGVLTGGLTAFYMFRLLFLTFYGQERASRETMAHVREPGAVVMAPLYVLAVLSLVGGYLGPSEAFVPIQDANSFGNFLAPVFGHAGHGEGAHGVSVATERWMAAGTTAVAAMGILLALWLYVGRPELPARLAAATRGLYRALANKYWIDELYDALIVRPLVAFSDAVLYRGVDAGLIDGAAVNGPARAVRGLAAGGLKYVQSGLAQGYLVLMVLGMALVLGWLVR